MPVKNTGFFECIALRLEAEAFVEWNRFELGVECEAIRPVRLLAGRPQQFLHQGSTDTSPPPFPENRDPPDPSSSLEARGPDRIGRPGQCKEVDRDGIVLVDFDLGRDSLLVDEDAGPDSEKSLVISFPRGSQHSKLRRFHVCSIISVETGSSESFRASRGLRRKSRTGDRAAGGVVFPAMGGIREAFTGMSGWKGKVLLFAGACVVFGVALNSDRYFGDEESIAGSDQSTPSMRTDWTSNSKTRMEIEQRAHSWGDAAIRFGGSFMVAMIVASLLRAFVKTMAVALVVVGVLLFYLDSRGMVEPFWQDAFESWEQAKSWLIAQTDTFVGFLKGYVPSMTAALLGFGFGLRK